MELQIWEEIYVSGLVVVKLEVVQIIMEDHQIQVIARVGINAYLMGYSVIKDLQLVVLIIQLNVLLLKIYLG